MLHRYASVSVVVLCLLTTACRSPNTDQTDVVPVVVLPTDPLQSPNIAIALVPKKTVTSATPPPVQPAAPAFMQLQGQSIALDRSILNIPLLYLPATVKDTVDNFPILWEFAHTVRFALSGDLVQLWQDPIPGSRTTNLLPVLLASFPVQSATADTLVIDFQAGGLQDLIAGQDPWAQPAGSARINMNLLGRAKAAGTQQANLVEAVATPEWFSVIQQVNRVDGAHARSTWYRHTFRFAAASTVAPLYDDPADPLGYFTVPVAQAGKNTPNEIVRRWNPDRPVTFYLSANTPPQYRDAVRQGVLAWNQVLPDPAYLSVTDAPPSVLPGDPRYPLIQWLDDENGFGVGMAQADPRTGEILTGLVVITSGWVDPPKPADLLPSIPAETAGLSPRRDSTDPTPALLCTFDASAAGAEGPFSAGWDLTPAARTTFTERLITAVIMHEVGHVLGLRHNFAGNLGSEDDHNGPLDLAAILDQPPAADAKLPSSSIMDYLPFYDDIRMSRPGAYDANAVNHSYGTLEHMPRIAHLPAPLFCTDEDVGAIADCQRFDGGRDPIDGWAVRLERLITAYNDWIIAHAIVAPNDVPIAPTLDGEAFRTLQLLRRGLKNLASYASGHTWPIGGLYPFERADKARRLLARLLRPISRDIPALVRPALAAQVDRLLRLAEQDDAQGRWAAQIIINITDLLNYLPR